MISLSKNTYIDLNAELNLWAEDGSLQLDKDREAARAYFVEHVNQNTVFFHSLEEKTDHLIEAGLWDEEVVLRYGRDGLKSLMKAAYAHKFRFGTFMGAYKFYTSYALKTSDGKRYFERFEDRVVLTAIHYSEDYHHASDIVDVMMKGLFQPATPTFLNAGLKDYGEPVSCFMLRVEDNMESIGRVVQDSLQLSKRGGGVGILASNLRETGAPIKGIENQASGVIPVMKLLEDSFSYANQLGARQGAGVVYLNAHHMDIMSFLDTKRENADEKIRIKTLSLGVVIPDITFELAGRNEAMALFSAYDVEKFYGVPFADISLTEKYEELLENEEIRREYINAREFFSTLAEIQFESGYPYILFEDAANQANPAPNVGRITMSNLCVAPETRVLTDKGYVRLEHVAGQTVNAWNGEVFSPSQVEQTGEGEKLITVNLSNGASLDVTPYHKFYVQNTYHGKSEEIRAGELQEGDRLEKFELTHVDAPAPALKSAYTAGLHSAEGTYDKDGKPILRLYPGKTHLADYIDYRTSSLKPDSSGRISFVLERDILPKFVVPIAYDLQSRLDWFAGLIDGDGYGNGAVGIQIASIHAEFLEEVRVLLTTFGVHSKWAKHKDSGVTQFREGEKAYETKEIYRLVISGSEAQKLRELGMRSHRVIIEPYEHQRQAREFVRVVSVIDSGRVDDTYCLNEPARHRVVFEGVETGNCSEIMQPQRANEFKPDGTFGKVGQDVSCNLGSLNIARMRKLGREDFIDAVDTSYRFLHQVSEQTNIDSSPSVIEGNNNTRAIGLGQMNLHGWLIEEGVDYDSDKARKMFEAYMHDITLALIESSVTKAHMQGYGYQGWRDGRWVEIITEHGEYASSIKDSLNENGSVFAGTDIATRWDFLAKAAIKYGIANQHLQAIPPTGSISYINHATASIHPVTSPIEIRKEGKLGRVYYPQYGVTNDNVRDVRDAYELGPNAVIDMYAVANRWVDQGMSMTLFFMDTATTRDINKAQIRAHKAGLKSIYYIRIRQLALEGAEIEGCVSCML